VRIDLEESRRMEGRLCDCLKELQEAKGTSVKVKDMRAAAKRVTVLEHEL